MEKADEDQKYNDNVMKLSTEIDSTIYKWFKKKKIIESTLINSALSVSCANAFNETYEFYKEKIGIEESKKIKLLNQIYVIFFLNMTCYLNLTPTLADKDKLMKMLEDMQRYTKE